MELNQATLVALYVEAQARVSEGRWEVVSVAMVEEVRSITLFVLNLYTTPLIYVYRYRRVRN